MTTVRAVNGSIIYNSDNATFMPLVNAAKKKILKEYRDVIARLISSPNLSAVVISEYHQEAITRMAIEVPIEMIFNSGNFLGSLVIISPVAAAVMATDIIRSSP